MSIVTTKRSALTKAVTLFALAGLSVIAQPAAATFAAPDATGDTPTAAPARTGNDITGNDGGTSTATGGIQIDGVRATRQYDKPSVGSSVSVHVDYSGKKVAQGATFTVGLGEGLKVPAGLNKVPLKATTLDGTHEETIGECTVTNSGLDCEITADIAATLGGNGDLKAAYVDFSATIDSSATGKKTVDITVAGTTYTVSMGDGVIGEGYDKNPGKAMYSDGMENGLHRHRGWLWTGELPGGTEVTITDNGADVLASKAYCTANHSWAKKDEIVAENNKLSADKHTITFTVPAGDNINCRVALKKLTEGLYAHNEATINGATFTAENTWRAKGSSGGSTDEDAKPVTPTPEPTPDPTPKPSEPPAPTPEPSEPPAPTPEPSTPPVTPDPEPPAPTPDPTPEAPKPDPKPEPTPEPSEPPAPTPAPTPDAPKPDPKPTPEQPTPDPKPTPDTPPVTPDPEPSVPPVSPDPKPSTPPVTPTPEPSEPPATPEPKPSEPTTPVTPNTPSTPDTPPVTPKAPTPSTPASNGSGTLAKTGADAGLIAGAGALAVVGSALLVARRRQNKN